MDTKKKRGKLHLLIKRVAEWRHAKIPSWVRENERQRLLKAYSLYKLWYLREPEKKPKSLRRKREKKETFTYTKRNFWVAPKFTEEERMKVGASNTLVMELRQDREKFIDFFQMDLETFEELFAMVEHKITKQTVVRKPIPARTRFEICIRFLASHDNTKVIGDLFRVGHNTVSKMIPDVCLSIYEVLESTAFPKPTEEMWKQKASEYKDKFGFPNCIGFVDEKCVVVKQPGCSNDSTVKPLLFLSVSDCNNMFTAIEVEEQIGRYGLFHTGEIGHDVLNNSWNVPESSQMEDNESVLPYVLLGSDPFILSSKVMRPYEEEYYILSDVEQNFNENFVQIQSNAMCTFDIFAARWKVFSKPICASSRNITRMIMAATCLHNYLMKKDFAKPLKDRYYSITKDIDIDFPPTAFVDNLECGDKEVCKDGANIRDAFALYLHSMSDIK